MEGKEGREGMEGGKGGKEGKEGLLMLKQHIQKVTQYILKLNQFFTVCPGRVTLQKKYFNIFASEYWVFIYYDILG